jgi:hypothetical protein
MSEQQVVKMDYLRYKSRAQKKAGEDRVKKISHLRDSLGWAYQQVIESDQPIIIQRYKAQEVAIVPMWEWQFFKQLEAQIKAGCCPVGREQGETCPCSQSR